MHVHVLVFVLVFVLVLVLVFVLVFFLVLLSGMETHEKGQLSNGESP